MSYQPSLGRDYGLGLERGARTGALIGAGVGLVALGLGIAADTDGCQDCFMSATAIAGIAALGITLGGTVLGAGIGAVTAPTRWGEARSVAWGGRSRAGQQWALILSLAP